jgi:hypothetical protein
MHRALAFHPAIALLASCSFLDGPNNGDGPPLDPPTCEGPCDPGALDSFDFETGSPRLAAGASFSLGYGTFASTDEFRIISDDPSVVAVEGVTGDTIELAALTPGSATLSAETPDGSFVLDQVTIRVVEVSQVEYRLRTPPIEPEPLGRVAGLVGSADSLRAYYRDSNGELLAGRARLSASGTVELRDPDTVESRLSEIFYDGERVAVGFAAVGPGTLSATFGERSFPLPIDVVRTVRAIEMTTLVMGGDGVIESDEVAKDHPIGADVIARRPDGTFVLGVQAEWTVDPASVDYWTDPDSATEVVFTGGQARTYRVTATHGSLSSTRSITVH